MNEAGWRTTLIVPEHALFGRELSSFSLTYQTNTSRFCCTASASSCMFTENGNACSRFSRQFHLVTTKIYRSEIPYCPKRPIQRTDVPSSHYTCGLHLWNQDEAHASGVCGSKWSSGGGSLCKRVGPATRALVGGGIREASECAFPTQRCKSF